MPHLHQRHIKPVLLVAVVFLSSTIGPVSVDGSLPEQCETCWNEYFAWNWHHNFPENDGQWDCETGDGCHGEYYELKTCDGARHVWGCSVRPDELAILFSLSDRAGNLDVARQLIERDTRSVALDRDNRRLLVAGCSRDRVAASIPLTDAQVTALLGN